MDKCPTCGQEQAWQQLVGDAPWQDMMHSADFVQDIGVYKDISEALGMEWDTNDQGEPKA